MKMKATKVFTPPLKYDNSTYTINGIVPLNLFLGGTIDNGNSLDWQKSLVDELCDTDTVHPIMIYNPRREDWPDSDNKEEIEKQINWELYHLERSDLIVMNILGNSKSPISLMEIGLYARTGRLIVLCNPNFYRFDNVRIVCKTYNVPLYETNDILVIKNKILERANEDADITYDGSVYTSPYYEP
jgi:hypothetical protein